MSGEGLSDVGLGRLHDTLVEHVHRGDVPGLVALVARHGDVDIDVIGTMAFGDTVPMPRNAVFRIAALTKPIAAAAAMTFVDDGTLRLDTPVDDLLPELANRQVLRSIDAEIDDTVPARRAITVEDLLSSRFGLGVVLAMPGTYPIQRAEADRRLMTFGPPWPPTPHTPDEWIARLGELPLIHQPGEGWMYNTGLTVLGVLLARAGGMPLEQVLQERIFAPLGMTDTGFSMSRGQRDRMTTAYTPDPQSGELTVLDGVDGYWNRPPLFPDAGGWLLSTVDDVWAFAQMMVNNGEHDGTRILSAGAVQAMTTNRLTHDQRIAADMFVGPDAGWGLGMAVPIAGHEPTGLPRGYGWNGGTGTTWYSDPGSGLTGILLTQRAMTSPEPPAIFVDFWNGAYHAIGS